MGEFGIPIAMVASTLLPYLLGGGKEGGLFGGEKIDFEAIMTPEMKEGQKKALQYLISGLGKGATPLPSNMPLTSPIPTSAYQAMNIPMSYFLGMPYTHRGYGTLGSYGLGGGRGRGGGLGGGVAGESDAERRAREGKYPASIPKTPSGDILPIEPFEPFEPPSPFEAYRREIRRQPPRSRERGRR